MEIDEFSALASRSRRMIINRIRMGPKSVEQIAGSMKVSRPAVSQGLRILLQARLVKRESRGRKVFYSLDKHGVERLETYVDGLLDVTYKYADRKPGE